MSITTSFPDRLKEIQDREGFTDSQMAQLIGCSRQLYQMTRTSRVEIGTKILKGAVKAFPELSGDAFIFLTNGANEITGMPKSNTTPHQTHQDGKIARLKTWWDGVVLRAKKIWHNSREL